MVFSTLGITALTCMEDETVGDMKCGDFAFPEFSSPGRVKGFGVGFALRRFVLLALAVISLKVPMVDTVWKGGVLLSDVEDF